MNSKQDKKILAGNVGEWSEIYVFFRLLATGKMNVADVNLVSIPDEFYKVLAILRKEATTENTYLRTNDTINIVIKNNINSELEELSMSVAQFTNNADKLLQGMQNQSGKRSATYPEIQAFMNELRIYSIKDVGHKRDITITIEDFHCGAKPTLGFSIKSFVGKQSTLFNPGAGTNFIYKIIFPKDRNIDCDEFNKMTYYGKPGKIACRLSLIEKLEGKICFEKIQSDCLCQNLRTIDGDLPRILAYALILKYQFGFSNWKDIVSKLNQINPLDYRISNDSPVYEVKIKRFLQDAAMGMTPESPWDGFYDATGGQIVVKKDGDIVCYHVYELNRYLQYLYDSTKLEQASTSEDEYHPGHVRLDANGKSSKPYQFGWLYKEGDSYYMKLNLQVRFK